MHGTVQFSGTTPLCQDDHVFTLLGSSGVGWGGGAWVLEARSETDAFQLPAQKTIKLSLPVLSITYLLCQHEIDEYFYVQRCPAKIRLSDINVLWSVLLNLKSNKLYESINITFAAQLTFLYCLQFLLHMVTASLQYIIHIWGVTK